MAYTAETFLAKIKPMVIKDAKETGILPSLTAAQALIESNKGNSGLACQCNNLFGIKGYYMGQSGLFWTTEYYNGVKTRVQANFRKYPTWQESITDHSHLFTSSKRYKNLVGCTDYIKACTYVKEDGYATSPTYTNTLINCINTYKLYLCDAEVTGKVVTMRKAPTLPILKRGSKGQQVMAWQLFLMTAGFNPGLADGKFGPLMEEAVAKFQASKGITPDGVIGIKTWAATGIDYSKVA